MTDYNEVFKNVAINYKKRGDKHTNKQNLELARYNYSTSVPYFCESSILSKIYGDLDESEKCINAVFKLKEKIDPFSNNFSLSVFDYAEAINLAQQHNFERCITKLNSARTYLNNSGNEYNSLYHSWIFCEIGFGYNKINEIDKSLINYICGIILLKSIEIKNAYYKTTRKYLEHAILSKPDDIFSDIVDDLNQIAISSKNKENYHLSAIYFCETAILKKIKHQIFDSKKSIKDGMQLIKKIENNNDNFSKSLVFYINGVFNSLQSDFLKFNNENIESESKSQIAINNFKKSKDMLEVRNIEHLILYTFLSREIAYCEQKSEMSENSSYFIDAITLMKELDWILTLYERTLGLLYQYIGNIQMEKLISNKRNDDDFISTNNLKEYIKNYDEKLNGFVEHLNEAEWKEIKIEINSMRDPLFDYDKSLIYLADVNDEIVVTSIHMAISQIYVNKGNLYRAKLELEIASKKIDCIDNDLLKAQYHHSCAYIDWKMRNIKSAISEYTYALKYAKKLGSKRAQILIYNNIIPLLIELNEFNTAFEYCKEAIELIENDSEQLRNKSILVKLYTNYAILHILRFENYKNAEKYLIKSEDLVHNINDPHLINLIESVENWIYRRQSGMKK